MSPPLQDSEEEFEEPRRLRRLRLLVTVLTSVLIFGMLTMVVAVVIRLGVFAEDGSIDSPGIAVPIAAEGFTLPKGARITGLGRGGADVLILTDGPEGEVLRVFDTTTGEEISRVPIVRQ